MFAGAPRAITPMGRKLQLVITRNQIIYTATSIECLLGCTRLASSRVHVELAHFRIPFLDGDVK